jgi:hypothetical protein
MGPKACRLVGKVAWDEKTGGVITLTESQVWSLIGLLGAAILASPTVIVLYLRSEIGGLRREMMARFEMVDRRFDHLDRDIQAFARVVFPEG